MMRERHAGAGRGGEVGLLKLFQPDLAHGLERQLPLFGAALLKPGKALPHVLETCAQSSLEGFVD